MHKFQFEAIGTHWEIDLYSENSVHQTNRKIQDLIDSFDKTYSRFREDSLIVEMSKKAGTYEMPDNASNLISVYEKIYRLTDGLVTPLIGSVMEEAGYDKVYSLKSKSLNRPLSWEEALEFKTDSGSSFAKATAGKQDLQQAQGKARMTIKKPVLLDFGAAGKGYLIDLVGELLQSENINSFCIDAGGDILYRTSGDKPIQIGLENPINTNQVIGSVNLLNQSICGSAGNRRKWGEFHHIMNPKTLKPVDEIAAVWVIAESGLIADALSTCLFFVKPEDLEQEFHFEYVIVDKDFRVRVSKNFNGELYYT